MKLLILVLVGCFALTHLKAQNDCYLIENNDPGLTNVSYQTVFVTVVSKKDKFNIKFWKFKDKFAISCFVVTKDTFCVDPTSSVTFNFTDGSSFSFVSDKKQNCRGELNKDYQNGEQSNENHPLQMKKVASIDINGIDSNKSFIVDQKTAASIQHVVRCITGKKIK